MLRLGSALSFLFIPGLAAAEVCDKVVGDWWRREHGPQGVFIDWGSTWPVLLAASLSLGCILLTRSRGLAWASAVVALLPVVLILIVMTVEDWHHPVIQGAIREGCTHPNSEAIQLAGYGLLAAGFALIASSRILIRKKIAGA